jgi:phosphonate transport system substrate-binding protein
VGGSQDAAVPDAAPRPKVWQVKVLLRSERSLTWWHDVLRLARAAAWIAIGPIICFTQPGCPRAEPAQFIDLRDVERVPATPPAASESDPQLRVAVSSMISPDDTLLLYQEFMHYLGERSGRRVILKQRRTYGEVNELLARGELDLAFLCSAQYVEMHDRYGVRLLAVPVVEGETVYRSYIIVGAQSGIQSFAQLRGKKFAFVDPLSNTGYFVPAYLLARSGEEPDTFFSSSIFTDSHDNSVRAVSDGLVDGAAVDSLVYDFMAARWPDVIARTRVIQRSRPFGIPPLVVPADIDQDLEARLGSLVMQMHEDAEGEAILAQLAIDRFAPGEDAAYDDIRQMYAFLAGRGESARQATVAPDR